MHKLGGELRPISLLPASNVHSSRTLMTVFLHILRQHLTITSLLTYDIDGTANNKQIN